MLSKEEIKHIANLARLELSEEEEEKYSKQLSSVLSYIDKLAELDISSVKENYNLDNKLNNVWREDEVRDWDRDELELALKQADMVSGQVQVKKVL